MEEVLDTEVVKRSSWIDSRRCLLCQTRGTETTLFRFPANPEMKRKWAEFCYMDPNLLTTKDCLCINHFPADQIGKRLPTSKKTKLKLTAVPCFMDPSDRGTQEPIVMVEESEDSSSLVQSANSTQSENSSHPVRSPTIIEVTSSNDRPKSKKRKTTAQPKLPSEFALEDLIDSADEEITDLVQFEKITVVDLTSPKKRAVKNTVRYIGDVTAEHLKSHETAVQCFFVAKNALEDSRKKIKALRRQVVRLKQRLKEREEMLLKKIGEPTEDSISDDDFSWPLEDEDSLFG